MSCHASFYSSSAKKQQQKTEKKLCYFINFAYLPMEQYLIVI